MPISLVKALGLKGGNLRLAIVGSGGKTTAMFRISRQIDAPVLMITTTHIGIHQADLADEIRVITDPEGIGIALNGIKENQTTFLTGGETNDGRFTSICDRCQDRLIEECALRRIPLLVEADGARGLPLKAPAKHEPVIPEWANNVLVVAGLQGLNQPLNDEHVHRPESFANISGLDLGKIVTPGAVARVLGHPEGGQKRIPDHARRMVLLNQVDTELLLSQSKQIAEELISEYDCIAIGRLLPEEERFEMEIEAVYVPIASIILAAGGSERLGQPKALIEWKGETMVHRSARIASEAGLAPVIIVAGDEFESISRDVSNLDVKVVQNLDWRVGQSSSLKVGLAQIPERNGAVIFQVVDQPGLTVELLWSLIELHRQTRAEIIQPHAAGSRANPVLFDRFTFDDLMTITGDQGGRALFHRYNVLGLPWHDTSILIDLDAPEDLEKLRLLE